MPVVFFSLLYAILSVLLQCVFLGSPEYILSLDPIRIGLSAVISTASFLVADIVNERYGFEATMGMIIFGIFAQGLTVTTAHVLGIHVGPLMLLGLTGLLCAEVADAAIYAGMRRLTGERFLLLRTFCSTTTGLLIESAALLSAAPALILIAPQFTWKFLGSLLNLPIVFFFRERLFGK
jgi:uncharacterized PurR-regulated membrane protein YhhQ (DUF165 family)